MQVFDGFEELVHHIALVDIFEQCAFLYHCVQIGICAKREFFSIQMKKMKPMRHLQNNGLRRMEVVSNCDFNSELIKEKKYIH